MTVNPPAGRRMKTKKIRAGMKWRELLLCFYKVRNHGATTIFFLYSQITTVKVLKVKLEYWLPGITIEASGPRQPVDNGIKTEWSPIRSVIIRVINKIRRPRSGSPICLITSRTKTRRSHSGGKCYDLFPYVATHTAKWRRITKLTDHLTCKSLDKAEIEAITIIQRENIVSQMLQRGLLWPITWEAVN